MLKNNNSFETYDILIRNITFFEIINFFIQCDISKYLEYSRSLPIYNTHTHTHIYIS